jgi:hypothetical protein
LSQEVPAHHNQHRFPYIVVHRTLLETLWLILNTIIHHP